VSGLRNNSTTIGESFERAMLCAERVEGREFVSRGERGDGKADEEVKVRVV
jgi:hypothetical protein